jgi:protein PsiE
MTPIQRYGSRMVTFIEDVGLLAIGVATVISIGSEVWTMVQARAVTLADLLLLFIYLEVLAMVGIYLRSGKLPVRMPVYIAIVALARYLILDMKAMDNWRIVTVAGAALILGAAVLVIRYGHLRFPYPSDDDGDGSR